MATPASIPAWEIRWTGWWATVRGVKRVRHDLATKPPYSKIPPCLFSLHLHTCLYISSWGMNTNLFLRPSYCFAVCWFFNHSLALSFKAHVLLFTPVHLLLVVASWLHFSHCLKSLFLNIWAQISGPGVLRYQVQCLCHWRTELQQCQSPDENESPEGGREGNKVHVMNRKGVSYWGREFWGTS